MKNFRKYISAIAALSLVICLSACSESEEPTSNSVTSVQSNTENTADNSSAAEGNSESKILIAYFSVPMDDGVDTVSRASRKQWGDDVFGNVRYMAYVIQQNVGGDLFSIESADGYPLDSMDALLEKGYSEKADNARPELTSHIDNLEDYDTIFIGYPNWNADLPMPLYSFFDEYDFSGKTIIPFVAHGGSGASRTVSTISELEPNADVIDNPVTVFWNELDDAEKIVTDWVTSLNLN